MMTPPTGEAGTAWKPAILQTAIRQLAHYLGPIATMLVRREARRAQNVEALYQRLALHLADEQERQQFLKTAPLHPDDPVS
jgi:serine/threonine-protein kinase